MDNVPVPENGKVEKKGPAMNILSTGTKSLLVGAHQFVIHPLSVALSWKKLYGRWPRAWEALAILVHDLGYWGCKDMDGPEGLDHPALGASIAYRLCGLDAASLVEGHSRSYVKKSGCELSPLAAADKLSWEVVPWWIYIPGALLSGEIHEYRIEADRYHRRTGQGCPLSASHRTWYRWLQSIAPEKARACRVALEGCLGT
jgi:hypothetical protein